MIKELETMIKELHKHMEYLQGQVNVVEKELLKTTLTSYDYAVYNINKIKESINVK